VGGGENRFNFSSMNRRYTNIEVLKRALDKLLKTPMMGCNPPKYGRAKRKACEKGTGEYQGEREIIVTIRSNGQRLVRLGAKMAETQVTI